MQRKESLTEKREHRIILKKLEAYWIRCFLHLQSREEERPQERQQLQQERQQLQESEEQQHEELQNTNQVLKVLWGCEKFWMQASINQIIRIRILAKHFAIF